MSAEHSTDVEEPPHQRTQQEVEQVTTHGTVTYLEAGDPAAPAVVFLHGIGGGARLFQYQLDAFGAEHRAIAWNMPGYGGSSPLELVSIDSLTAALGAFLHALHLDRPVLVGHSIGGMLVQRLLALSPHAARAAVLAQTSAAFGSKDPAWAHDFIQARLGPLDAGHGMAELADGMVAELAGDGADPAGLALARDCIAATPDSTYRDTVLALPGFDEREALGRILVPALVLSGTRDRSAPAPAMERMAGRIPGATYAALEGAGHLAMVERPDAFNDAVLAFLRGLDRP